MKFLIIISLFIYIPFVSLSVFANETELPAIKVAMSDDQAIIIDRVMYEALKRTGHQMITQVTGMRTAIANVNYGDAAVLPLQTYGLERQFENLIRVPVIIDSVEMTVYTRTGTTKEFAAWSDLAGLRLGYRRQNAYVVNNIYRTGAASLVAVNEVLELWAVLVNDEADAVILPRVSHHEHKFPVGVSRAGVVDSIPCYSYVNNSYAYLVPLLEKAYLEMIEDGTVSLINNSLKLSDEKRIVLHINSYNAQNELERIQMENINRILYEKDESLEAYSVYLNSNNFHNQARFNIIVSSTIRADFVQRSPDLIIASGNEAFNFVINNYYFLFPNTPVLFHRVAGFDNSLLHGIEANVTGFAESISFYETVSAMLRLYPETRRIFILNGHTLAKSMKVREEIDNYIKFRDLPVEFLFNENKPFAEILEDIRAFAEDTLVLIGNYFYDSDNILYSESYVQRAVSQVSGKPVFCLTVPYIWNGVLGGLLSGTDEYTNAVSSAAYDLLRGKSSGEIPVMVDSSMFNRWQFNYQTLKKFNIDTKSLPVGNNIVNRPASMWESNPLEYKLMLALILMFICVIILVFNLFIKSRRTEKRWERIAGKRMRELEFQLLKLNMAMKAANIWMWEMEVPADNPANPVNAVSWPDELRALLGYEDKNDFPNRLSSYFACMHPEDLKWVPNAAVSHMLDKTGKTPYNVEYRLMKKNGECVYIHATGETIRGKDGNPLRTAGTIIDVTHKRHLLNEVENQRAKAEAANKAKSEFLSHISHEIRTPMNAVIGAAEIQLQKESLSPDAEEAFNMIYNSGNILLNIINNILDLSKIESGKMELMPAKYDILSLVSDTIYLNVLRYESKPIEFFSKIDEQTPLYMLGDELRIKQILNNLLSNAFKYTEKGKIELLVKVEEEIMSGAQATELADCTLVLRVSDTGQGMTAEQIDVLFDEYTRFNMNVNRTTLGTGLGMSITRHLIKLMNGEILVESEVDLGSVFTVRLPQKRIGPEKCVSELTDEIRHNRLQNISKIKRADIMREHMPYGSVLIVDDVESNLYVAKGMMLPYGLEIETVTSGFEAMEKIKSGIVYDIIFMDHMMPKMDGMETTKKIRDMGYKHSIVALTANAIVGQAEMFLANGFDGFISKPIDSRELNAILNNMIRDKRQSNLIHKETQNEPDSIPKIISEELVMAALRDIENAVVTLNNILPALDASNEEDIKQLVTTIHGIKSALANIGEKKLSDAALKLEKAGNDKNMDIILDDMSLFIDVLLSLKEKYKSAKKNNG